MARVTLILLPGMDGTGTLFAPFVAALGPEFEVKVVSYPTNEPLGYDALQAIAYSALPQEGEFVILGESFSGPIAVALAAAGSPRLKGLILCCTFVRNPLPALSTLKPLVGVLPVALAPVRAICHLLLGHFSTSGLRMALANALAQVTPSVIRARLHSVLSVDVSDKLVQVEVPVLYLRASQDRLVPRSASEHIFQLCPKTMLVQLAAPHFLLQAIPSEASQVVASFVREVSS